MCVCVSDCVHALVDKKLLTENGNIFVLNNLYI